MELNFNVVEYISVMCPDTGLFRLYSAKQHSAITEQLCLEAVSTGSPADTALSKDDGVPPVFSGLPGT